MAQSPRLTSMFRRGNTPTIRPSLETSNQTQIDDLVKRNRILEQTNKRLTDQLNLEQHRAKELVSDTQKQLQIERKEWREGCDTLVSCHRLAHLRTIADLETMKTKVLQEEESRRREKVQRLHRDARIAMFQIRETELEDKVADLEDERQRLVAHYEGTVSKFRRNLSLLVAERKAKAAELSRLERESEQLQDKLSQLREEHVTLQTLADSNIIKLERASLQFEGAQARITELERTSDELRRTNVDLQRQLEKWQNLETKGNGELETLRKQKILLEAKVSTLQDRLDKQSAEREKESEKISKRDEKAKELMAQWQIEAEDQRLQREKADDALAQALKRIRQLEGELKDALPNAAFSGTRIDDRSPTNNKTQPTNKRSRSPPRSNRGKQTNVDDVISISESSELPRKATAGKKKSKLSPVSEVEEVGGGLEERDAPKKPTEEHNKPAKPTKKGKGKARAVIEDSVTEDDAEKDAKPSPRAVPKPKRRRKPPASDGDDVEIPENRPVPAKKDTQQKGRRRQRKEESTEAHNSSKNNGDASSDDGNSTVEQAPVKKKRKINIFSNPVEPTFAFMGNDIGIGLNIPTTLSPVKESGIPGRSASVMSRIMSKSRLR